MTATSGSPIVTGRSASSITDRDREIGFVYYFCRWCLAQLNENEIVGWRDAPAHDPAGISVTHTILD